MEYANKDGMLNMDKIVDTSTALYTFFETLNTLKIEDFNEQTILEAIKFE